ncbi:MAG: hypothetical protein V5A64_07130 [Candidatus Thermoplasmatota archaeon]
MIQKNNLADNKFYILTTVFIITVIILAVLFSGRGLYTARISSTDQVLEDKWYLEEDRQHGEDFLGLEQWSSLAYVNENETYPAYLTVTTIKTLFMMGEKELYEKTRQTILDKTKDQNITIDKKTEKSGGRVLNDGHQTSYLIFNGTDSSSEKIKIIGESWNCDKSGTSIICIGFAQVTNNNVSHYGFWKKIIRDSSGSFGKNGYMGDDGLIFNVKCH